MKRWEYVTNSDQYKAVRADWVGFFLKARYWIPSFVAKNASGNG